MTGPPSRPARALRVGAVVVAVLLALRLPVMKARFDAAVTAANGAARVVASAGAPGAPPFTAPARDDAGVAHSGDSGDGRNPATSHRPPFAVRQLGSGLRRNDGASDRRAHRPAIAPVEPAVRAAPATLLATMSTPGSTTAAPVALAVPAADPPDAGTLATAAYARLAAGDRRAAVRLFDQALGGGAPRGAARRDDDPRAATWRRQRDALTRRWSGSAYSIVRASGPAGLAAEPVLGGGQSGGAIAFTPDPLSPRPVALVARGSVGHDDAGRSAYVGVGVEWRPLAGVTLAAERRVAVGPAARDDWVVRLAAGFDRTRARLRLTGYGEGGIVGGSRYAAGQARVAVVGHDNGVAIEPGVGAWASVQYDHGATVERVEVGPGVVAHAGPLAVAADYRFRVAGNAAPGSGPVVTLSAVF